MKKENYDLLGFINSYNELRISFRDVFVHSFHKNIVSRNIPFIKENKYVISNEVWNIHELKENSFMHSFVELVRLHSKEYSNDLEKIEKIFFNESVKYNQFIVNILNNEQKKIIDFARQKNISDDFITFFSVFIALPYRNEVSLFVQEEKSVKEHISGFCPICGHWPGMAYIVGEEGKKVMSCISCGTSWLFRRLTCSFCYSTDHDLLGYLNIDGENEISAYTCDKCRRYLKTKRIDENIEVFTIEEILLDYMSSGHVDIASMQNKYVQESVLGTRFLGPNDKHLDSYLLKILK